MNKQSKYGNNDNLVNGENKTENKISIGFTW